MGMLKGILERRVLSTIFGAVAGVVSFGAVFGTAALVIGGTGVVAATIIFAGAGAVYGAAVGFSFSTAYRARVSTDSSAVAQTVQLPEPNAPSP